MLVMLLHLLIHIVIILVNIRRIPAVMVAIHVIILVNIRKTLVNLRRLVIIVVEVAHQSVFRDMFHLLVQSLDYATASLVLLVILRLDVGGMVVVQHMVIAVVDIPIGTLVQNIVLVLLEKTHVKEYVLLILVRQVLLIHV